MYDVILSKYICTDAVGYQHLVDVYDDINNQSDMDVTLVFDECEHIDANLSAVLGSLLDDLKSSGYSLWLTHPTSVQVRDNLSRNNFSARLILITLLKILKILSNIRNLDLTIAVILSHILKHS